MADNKEAILQKTGQINSSAVQGTPPLIVASTFVVENLNADMVDGIDANQFLRTDANTALNSTKELSINGEIIVKDNGILTLENSSTLNLGSFKLNFSGSLVSLGFTP